MFLGLSNARLECQYKVYLRRNNIKRIHLLNFRNHITFLIRGCVRKGGGVAPYQTTSIEYSVTGVTEGLLWWRAVKAVEFIAA